MPNRRKSHILVVDDDPNVAKTLAMVLQQQGYLATFTLNGSTALELASGCAVDLAIVDVNLPELDGIQTAVELCRRLPKCKILLMSGDIETSSKLEEARANGINFDVIVKPIPPEELFFVLNAQLTESAAAAGINV